MATVSSAPQASVLVVDDDDSLRLVLTESLSDAGYSVDGAESAFAAAEKLRRARYDIILLDVNLPAMTGLELMREIRGAKLDCEVAIMTANATPESAIEALKLGVADYVLKPFRSLDHVLQLVAQLAKRGQDRRAKADTEKALLHTVKRAVGVAGPRGGVDALVAKAERVLGVRAGGTEDTDAARKVLSGDLGDFPLMDLLQLIVMMKKTGTLQVAARGGAATVAADQGEFVAAQFGSVRDLKAIFRLLREKGGTFLFHPGVGVPTQRRIVQGGTWVLMEAARQLDEYSLLTAPAIPAEASLSFSGSMSAVTEMFDRVIAARLSSPRVLRELVDESPEPDVEVLRAVYRMRDAGLLKVQGVAARPVSP